MAIGYAYIGNYGRYQEVLERPVQAPAVPFSVFRKDG